ncbi:MAG TPA: ABC transporter ATP-binding protein [Planctomycetota bacterium]|nr:ABC transporter ATP-binding protein [Planctomycetota bacterium]
MPEPLIAAEKVVKRYVLGEESVTAVDGVTVGFQPGGMTAVIGRSGSGKSTLLHLLGGLDRPTSGRILARGRRLDELSDDDLADFRRTTVGFIFQSFQLLPAATAQRNVELPLVLAGVPPAERRTRAEKLLDRVGLLARRHHKPSQLSGGEQQRVAIARALANEPPLLLCDEPTGNLDSRTAGDLIGLLRDLASDGRTVILVTHDRALAESSCSRRIELSDGRVVADTKAVS